MELSRHVDASGETGIDRSSFVPISGDRHRDTTPPERDRRSAAREVVAGTACGHPSMSASSRIAVVAAMSLGTLFYKEQLDYRERSHGSIRIESRMARISAMCFRGGSGDQFASIISRVPTMSRIQNCSVWPGAE